MGLTSGSRFGAYEIQSPLGAGGMGEVYRATDTKLGRDVAFNWVEKAVAERDFSMMIYLRFVVSKGLRASHRWPKIANMMNLPLEA